MSRRKPDCALCGERLRGAQIRVQLQGLPGSPEVGWHADTDGVDRRKPALKRCAWDDRLFRQIMDGRDEDAPFSETEEAIRTIQTRGKSRVSASKRWHEYLHPPPNPAKLTDPRAAAYIAQHGDSSWEVDALPPNVLGQLITAAITQYVDTDVLGEVKAREARERKALQAALAKLNLGEVES